MCTSLHLRVCACIEAKHQLKLVVAVIVGGCRFGTVFAMGDFDRSFGCNCCCLLWKNILVICIGSLFALVLFPLAKMCWFIPIEICEVNFNSFPPTSTTRQNFLFLHFIQESLVVFHLNFDGPDNAAMVTIRHRRKSNQKSLFSTVKQRVEKKVGGPWTMKISFQPNWFLSNNN